MTKHQMAKYSNLNYKIIETILVLNMYISKTLIS